MIREVPALFEFAIKFIAKQPGKCMTEAAVAKLLLASKNPKCIEKHNDIVQEVIDAIVESGRMTDEAVPVTIFRNRSLVSLGNSRVSGRYVTQLVEFCSSSLVELNVGGCFQVSNQHLSVVLNRCPNLQRINVKNCRKLGNEFLRELCGFPDLRLVDFNIGGNFNITNEGVKYFLQHFANLDCLESLSLSGLQINDDVILLLLDRCRRLRALGLAYLDLKESTILQIFKTLGPQLEQLDLSWPSTTPGSKNGQPSAVFLVENLPSMCPNLTMVDLSANRNLQLPHVQEIIERKLSPQMGSGPAGKPFEVLHVKFIATPKANVETLKYQGLKLVC